MNLVVELAKLQRKLKRYEKFEKDLNGRHQGREQNFTYHGGWSLGYVQGKISEIEERIWDLERFKSILEGQ